MINDNNNDHHNNNVRERDQQSKYGEKKESIYREGIAWAVNA